MSVLIRAVAFVLACSLVLAVFTDQVSICAGADDAQAAPANIAEIRLVPDSNEPATLDQGASINPKLLGVIDDRTEGITSRERAVYFQGLKLAAQTPLWKQQEAARQLQRDRMLADPKSAQLAPKDFPQFVDLFQNPDVYRGRPVSLKGTIRRLTKYDPGKNASGIGDVYEGWLYTADSNSNPVVVIFTVKPAELILAADFSDEIGVTGYFFKQYSYAAEGGPGIAPMLLAGTVEWHPGPRHYTFKPLSPVVYVVLTLVLAILVYSMWNANRPRNIQHLLSQEDVDLAKLSPPDNH